MPLPWWQRIWGFVLIGVVYGIVLSITIPSPVGQLVFTVAILAVTVVVILVLRVKEPRDRPGVRLLLYGSIGASYAQAVFTLPVPLLVQLAIGVVVGGAALSGWTAYGKRKARNNESW